MGRGRWVHSLWSGVVALWAALLIGCGESPIPLVDVAVTDSGGVRTVSFESIASINAPTWNARRVYKTDLDETVLVNIEGAAFLPDGSLLVASLGTSDLVLLDQTGTETRRVGRKGEGPGEYRWPSWVQAVGDTVWVYDKGARRLTTLGADFSLLGTTNLDSDDALIPLAPLAVVGESVFAIHGASGHVRSEGELRDTTPLLRLGVGGVVDTLGLWPSEERAFATIPQGRLVVPIVFGRRAVAAGRGGSIVIGSTDTLDLSVLDGSGALQSRFVGSGPPAAVPPAEIEEYRQSLLAHLPMETAELSAAWSQGPVRETVPPLGAVAMDDKGHIWMAGSVHPGQKRRLWVVAGPGGEVYGRIELPTQFRPWPASSELLDIVGNRVALRFRGEYDEEYIEVWEWE